MKKTLKVLIGGLFMLPSVANALDSADLETVRNAADASMAICKEGTREQYGEAASWAVRRNLGDVLKSGKLTLCFDSRLGGTGSPASMGFYPQGEGHVMTIPSKRFGPSSYIGEFDSAAGFLSRNRLSSAPVFSAEIRAARGCDDPFSGCAFYMKQVTKTAQDIARTNPELVLAPVRPN